MDEYIDYNFDEFADTTIVEKIEEQFYHTISIEVPYKFITYALGYETSDMFGDKKTIGMRIKHNNNLYFKPTSNTTIVKNIFTKAEFIVAHNAGFDRAFLERYLPLMIHS